MSELPVLEDDQLTRLVVTVFRLNGALAAAGDRLVADLGLTTSRWQVLGSVAAAAFPLPIASVARNMGLTRQGVRVVVRDLAAAGLVRLAPNPRHRRAHLVLLTPEGERVAAAAMTRQEPWADALGRGLPPERIAGAADLLDELLRRLAATDQQGAGP